MVDGDVIVVVEEFVKAGRTFTAYDVTKALRTRGHRAYNHEVRPIVHNHMNGVSSYKGEQNFSLHSGGPIQYTQITVPAIAGNSGTTSGVVTQQTQSGVRSVKTGNRDRLWVNLKELGVNDGERVAVEVVVRSPGKNAIEIFKPGSRSSTAYEYYTADSTPGIKVAKDVLTHAFGSFSGQKFVYLSKENDKLVLTD